MGFLGKVFFQETIAMVPWLLGAFNDLNKGVKEVPGERSHPRILEYHLETTLKATSDEVPWCSAAMCAWFEDIGIPSTRSAAARSWLSWGVSLDKPREGCVVVFSRGAPESQSGHVAIYLDDSGDKIRVIGGNQGNEISIMVYSSAKVLGYRWPSPEHYRGTDDRDDGSVDS